MLKEKDFLTVDFVVDLAKKLSGEIIDSDFSINNLTKLHQCISVFSNAQVLEKELDFSRQIDSLIQSLKNVLKAQAKGDVAYFSGASGIVFHLVQLYRQGGNESYLKEALELALNWNDSFLESEFVGDSLYHGRAGVVLTFLALYIETKNEEVLVLIDRYTRKIIANAIPYQNALVWHQPGDLEVQPLCGFGNGVAGIGYVFLKLYQYFNHPPFYEIYKKALQYIQQTKRATDHTWVDYRRTITCAVDLEKHMQAYQEGQLSFFEKEHHNLSITDGDAGICFFYLQGQTTIADALLERYENEDMAHVFVDIANSKLSKDGLNNVKKYTHSILEKKEGDKLSWMLLAISLLKKESIHFLLPKVKIVHDQKRFEGVELFIKQEEIKTLILSKQFPKTIEYLKSVDQLGLLNKCMNEGYGMEALEDISNAEIFNAAQSTVLGATIDYEIQLWNEKVANLGSPLVHAKLFTELNERISKLNITDKVLLTKTLVQTPNLTSKAYYVVPDFQALEMMPRKLNVYWKPCPENGVEEMDLGVMKLIFNLFRKAKNIETALLEMIFYCYNQKEMKLFPLINFSNSKSKDDLIQRLPFLFLHMLRLLVADGVLIFSNEETDSTTKRNNLKTTLSQLGVY